MICKIEKKLEEIIDFIRNRSLVVKEIMSLEEAAIYMNVSKSYVYKLTSKREISFFRPGTKLIFFRKKDLDDWMLKNRISSKEEIMNKQSITPKYLQ